MGNKVKQNKNGKRKIDNSLTNLPVSIYVAPKGPIAIPLVDIGFEEDAVKRARHVYNNYELAKDSNIGTVSARIRKALRYMKDNVWDAIPAGVSNCTLSATQWVDPTNPIGSAKSIVVNPEMYGYNKIKENEAVPGNLVIAKVPNQDSFHTMMITGFTDRDGEYDFNGKKFQYRKGEPLVTYSRGGSDDSFIRQNVPLSVYTANSDGHTLNLYYRYNYPNEIFLPEITVEKALGGEITKSKDKYGHTYKEGNTIKTYPSVNWHNYRLDELGRGTAADGTKTVIPAIDEDQLIVTPHGNIVDYRGLQVPSQYNMQEHPSNDLGYQLLTSDLFNAMTLGGLHNLSPTQWARRAWDLGETAFGDKTFAEYINDWTFGNNGIVSNKFAREHPYLSTGINMAGDAAILGGSSWLNNRPAGIYVTHRSPKEFDINNFYRGTSSDIGLHVGDAGPHMGSYVYGMHIPKPDAKTLDIGYNNINHLLKDFIFDTPHEMDYIYATPKEKLAFLKEYLLNPKNRGNTRFPHFIRKADGQWIKKFDKDFHFNLRNKIAAKLSKEERKAFDKEADNLLEEYAKYDKGWDGRAEPDIESKFNEAAADLLHKYGINVVKYNNFNAAEGLKPSYFVTNPSVLRNAELIEQPGEAVSKVLLDQNKNGYPLIIPQISNKKALGGILSKNSDSAILADNNNYIQDFKGNKYGLPTVRYDNGGHLFGNGGDGRTTLPHVGDSWRNTETDESGTVVGYAPDVPYMGEDGKLYPTTSPVVKYDSGETLFGVTPQYTLPEVTATRHLRTPADNLDDLLATPMSLGINKVEERAADQFKNANSIGDYMGAVATAASPLFFNPTALANPYIDAALTSYFGAHGINDIANGNANAMTALEVLPMARLAKPLWNAGKGAITQGIEGAWDLAAQQGNNYARARQLSKAFDANIYKTRFENIEPELFADRSVPSITKDNAWKMTDSQWDKAYFDAIARGDRADTSRLRDLHFITKAPHSIAIENGRPKSLYHGTRTSEDLLAEGFSKDMAGVGNRGDLENFYLTNSPENAAYTGIKQKEMDEYIDKVSSVYDLFGTGKIPSTKELNSSLNHLYAQRNALKSDLAKLKINKKSNSTKIKQLESEINDISKNIDETVRRSDVVANLESGLGFLGKTNDAKVNALNFIKEPVNPSSSYRQAAADRLINTMYGTEGLRYSPDVLEYYANIEKPLVTDWGMSPTDANPLKANFWSPEFQDYNKKGKLILETLKNQDYDAAVNKNMFDVLFNDAYVVKNPKNIQSANAILRDKAGDIIPLSKRDIFATPSATQEELNTIFNTTQKPSTISWEEANTPFKITAENAASITPEQWTAAQDAAIVRGDMVEAQRLADLHADINGYNSSLPLYHGSSEKNITTFDPYAEANTWEGSGGTTFFTPAYEAADTYAKMKGIYDMTYDPGKVYRVYSAHKNPKIVDYDGASYLGTGIRGIINSGGKDYNILNPTGGKYLPDLNRAFLHDKLPIEGFEYPRYYASPYNKHVTWAEEKVAGSSSEEVAKAMDDGYDVAILKNIDEGIGPNKAKIGPIDDYAIKDPGLVKFSDVVTYDDNGVRIPLGERHNRNIKDSRWGILGPIVGATGYGLYDNLNSTNSDIHAYGGPLVQHANKFIIED